MHGAALKTAYSGVILSNEAAIFVVTQRRIKRFDVAENPSGIRARQAWSTAITHGSHVLLYVEDTFLIVTDTSGAHYGLSVETGEILWETKPVGEGDVGVILDDGSFLFASWDGAIQHLDPESGHDLTAPRNLDRQMRNLHVTDNGSLFFVEYVRSTVDTLPGKERLCRLDWPSLNCMILANSVDGAKVAVSPDGRRIALVESDNTLKIRRLSSEQTEYQTELPGPMHYYGQPVWSANSQQIAVVIENGHALFLVENLELISIFHSSYPAPAVFSPTASLVLLCDWSDAKLVRNA